MGCPCDIFVGIHIFQGIGSLVVGIEIGHSHQIEIRQKSGLYPVLDKGKLVNIPAKRQIKTKCLKKVSHAARELQTFAVIFAKGSSAGSTFVV
jgi:hypothetical protein